MDAEQFDPDTLGVERTIIRWNHHAMEMMGGLEEIGLLGQDFGSHDGSQVDATGEGQVVVGSLLGRVGSVGLFRVFHGRIIELEVMECFQRQRVVMEGLGTVQV
eukprot:scaffold421685_cov86-Attheya_sp.AAC.1